MKRPVVLRGQIRSSHLALVAVDLVLLAGAIAFGLGQRSEADDLRASRDDRRDVELVAAAFGEAYLTYDSADVRASDDAILALTTEAFAADFADNRGPGIEELFAGLDTTTDATTKEVFVGGLARVSARALVVVDVASASSSSGAQTLTDLSFVLELAKEGDEWRVDSVAPAPQPDVTGEPQG